MMIRIAILIIALSFAIVGCNEPQKIDIESEPVTEDTSAVVKKLDLKEMEVSISKKIDGLEKQISKSRLQSISNLQLLLVVNNLILLLITGLLVYFISYILRVKFRNQNSTISRLFEKYRQQVVQQASNIEFSGYTGKLEDLINQLESLVQFVRQNMESASRIKQNNNSGDQIQRDIHYQQTANPQSEEIIYFQVPHAKNKAFDVKNGNTSFQPGRSFYQLTISGNTATVEFCDNRESMQTALNNITSYVEIICDSSNEPKSGYSKIVTLEKGEAELRDDKWFVTKNVKIKYE